MHSCQEYSWDEIKSIAEELFCEMNGNDHRVWESSAELSWAEMSWKALTRNGLTSYDNECEKVLVVGQILTLAAMFCKFTELFFNKPVFIDYHEWCIDLNLDFFRLENALEKTLTRECWEKEAYREVIYQDDDHAEEVVEHEVCMGYCDDEHDSDVIIAAVKELICFQRQSVFMALVAEFGSIDLLHISLLRTQERDGCREWIENGMQPECYNKMYL